MKKIIAMITMCALCTGAWAQTASSQKFLNRYSALIERITDEYADNADSVAAWKAEHKKIQDLYKARYNESFTDDELEQYFKISTKYKNKMIQYKLSDLSVQADSLGNRIGKKVKRFGKSLKGVLGGLKEQSDENRSN